MSIDDKKAGFMAYQGTQHHYLAPTKLTPGQRDEIARRYAEGETSWSLAPEFGVTASYIIKISGRRQ